MVVVFVIFLVCATYMVMVIDRSVGVKEMCTIPPNPNPYLPPPPPCRPALSPCFYAQSDPKCRPSAAELLRFPCLQSEMERQLNEQVSQLHKERSHNDDLLKEVSALIQKQSQRNGRLSRTITWDRELAQFVLMSVMIRY